MRHRSSLTLGLVLLGACNDATGIRLALEAAAGQSIASAVLVTSAAQTTATLTTQLPSTGGAVALPNDLLVQLPAVAWELTFVISGTDVGGSSFTATARATSIPHRVMTVPIVLGNASVADGDIDGDSDGDTDGAKDAGRDASAGCDMFPCTFATGPPSWLAATPLPTPRAGLAATTVQDGGIFAIGGYVVDGGVTKVVDTVEALDVDAEKWSTQPALSQACAYLGAGTLGDGRIIAAGGTTSTSARDVIDSVELFTPGTSAWTEGIRLTTKRMAYGAVVGADGGFYAIGGVSGIAGSNNIWTDDVEVFFSPADRWSPAPMLPAPRGFVSAALGADHRLYAVQGQNVDGYLNDVVAFSLVNGWAAAGGLSTGLVSSASVGGPDGRVYTVGGGAGNTPTFAYLAGAPLWQQLPSLLVQRGELAAAVGADGRIYAIGGMVSGKPVANVEAYGPLLSLSPSTGAHGSTVQVSGENFAANATVSVTFGSSTAVLGSGTTDVLGTLVLPIKITVPPDAMGSTRIHAVDNRSQFPVSAAFLAN